MSPMRRRNRLLVGAAAVAGFVAVVLPLVWPIRALKDTVLPESLADGDSRFMEVDGVSIHYKTWGLPAMPAGGVTETAFVLLHGFGASVFSWHAVTAALAQRMPVVAFDRPGFGLTERPMTWTGADPYAPETQADATLEIMDQLGIRRAVLVGHSAGGTVAALAAARHPERVEALVLEDPAVFAGGPPAFLTPLFRTPQFRRLGPLFARSMGGRLGTDFLRMAWHDPAKITEQTREGYMEPLRSQDWDKALWLLTVAPRPTDLPGTMRAIQARALFITGERYDASAPEFGQNRIALAAP